MNYYGRALLQSSNPCVVHTLFTPKKDGSWRLYMDSCVTNKIIFKSLLIPRLDDLLDMIIESHIFLKIELRREYYQIHEND